ncbi:MAG: hypothetical protein BM485_03470 [Desulfobulbaceae bacterium DB1]|nr:MAG: hypothetical protein BM485_03470 [Desulfobulbaceae bacterium DB1]
MHHYIGPTRILSRAVKTGGQRNRLVVDFRFDKSDSYRAAQNDFQFLAGTAENGFYGFDSAVADML